MNSCNSRATPPASIGFRLLRAGRTTGCCRGLGRAPGLHCRIHCRGELPMECHAPWICMDAVAYVVLAADDADVLERPRARQGDVGLPVLEYLFEAHLNGRQSHALALVYADGPRKFQRQLYPHTQDQGAAPSFEGARRHRNLPVYGTAEGDHWLPEVAGSHEAHDPALGSVHQLAADIDGPGEDHQCALAQVDHPPGSG
mmetsp:Transcript_50372/g.142016  ORF Transcript_50372/g.142016 Transcript_50372/m.142016 type:complete len:200 (-) Transcript_50372:1394-1993(-)